MKKILSITFTLFSALAFCQQPSFMWTKQIGGKIADEGVAIVTDNNGNVFTAANAKDTLDADPGPGTQLFYGDQLDYIYLNKLDPAGNLIWAKQIRAVVPGYINVTGMNPGANNTIVFSGYFTNTVDFDPGAGTYTLNANGSTDGFACCLDLNGNFKWAKNIGGSGSAGLTYVYGMDVGKKGDVLLTGAFRSNVDFNPGAGSFSLTALGNGDAFLCKLDSTGSFVWAQQFGDTSYYDYNTLQEAGLKVSTDMADNIYVAGTFESVADFDGSTATATMQPSNAKADIFILKLTPSGSYTWVRQLKGPDVELVNALQVTDAGEAYVTGLFETSINLDPMNSNTTFTATTLPNSWYDVFLLKVGSNGSFGWAKQLTGDKTKTANGLYVGTNGNILLTGTFYDKVDFDPSPATHTLMANAATDIYILQLNSSGNFMWVYQMGGVFPFVSDMNTGKSITCDANGIIYTTGKFAGTGDMDPTSGTYTLSTKDDYTDIYITRLGSAVAIEKFLQSEENLRVYPNPTSGIVKIRKDNATTKIKVFNALGTEVMNLSSPATDDVNLSALPKGIYFIEVTGPTSVVTRKIVKE